MKFLEACFTVVFGILLAAVVLLPAIAFNLVGVWLWAMVIDSFWNNHVAVVFTVAQLSHVQTIVVALGLQALWNLLAGVSLNALSKKLDLLDQDKKVPDAKSVGKAFVNMFVAIILMPLITWLSLLVSTWWFAV